jgi:hypothetical protein
MSELSEDKHIRAKRGANSNPLAHEHPEGSG